MSPYSKLTVENNFREEVLLHISSGFGSHAEVIEAGGKFVGNVVRGEKVISAFRPSKKRCLAHHLIDVASDEERFFLKDFATVVASPELETVSV